MSRSTAEMNRGGLLRSFFRRFKVALRPSVDNLSVGASESMEDVEAVRAVAAVAVVGAVAVVVVVVFVVVVVGAADAADAAFAAGVKVVEDIVVVAAVEVVVVVEFAVIPTGAMREIGAEAISVCCSPSLIFVEVMMSGEDESVVSVELEDIAARES